MQKHIVKLGAVLICAVAMAGATALASEISGSPNTSSDWTQEFCLTDCTSTPTISPVTQVDFIMATSGVTFTSLSSVYTNINETTVDSSATTNFGATESSFMFSPADNSDVYWTQGYSPSSTSTPFSFYFEMWDNSTFITSNNSATSSDFVTWTGSSFDYTPMTSSVPEPASLALFAAGLIGLAGFAMIKRRRAAAK